MQNPPRTARRSKINSYDPPSRCLSAPAELSTMIVLHRSPSSPEKKFDVLGTSNRDPMPERWNAFIP